MNAHRSNGPKVGRLLLAAAALVSVALVACEPYGEEEREEREVEYEQRGVMVEDVEEDPAEHYGEQVTVAGEVDQILSPRAFMLEGSGFLWDHEIPVLTKSDVTLRGQDITADDALMVRGTVRPFVVAEIERELGWDLDPEIEIEMRDQPVIVAESISPVDQQASWTESEAEQAPA